MSSNGYEVAAKLREIADRLPAHEHERAKMIHEKANLHEKGAVSAGHKKPVS